MDFTARVLFVILCLGIAVLYQQYNEISQPLTAPKFDLNEYWGPGDKSSYKEDTRIITNRVSYPDKVINDLKNQLNEALKLPLTEPLENTGFEYGFNSEKLKEIIKYWKDDYLPRWHSREIFLWSLPHLTTQIQGLQIHFIHTKLDNNNNNDKKKKVFPVLLLHGWPGSVREFYDIIPKLAMNENSEYIFEVVAPSLPGYGWSQGASKKGLGPAQMAVIFRNLMLRLGYKKFFIQGGDWGSVIGSSLATLFPENVIGYHSNMCTVMQTPKSILKDIILNIYPSYGIDEKYTEFYPSFKDKFELLLEESGYFHIQATKPDTIGIALINNPVGLAAYILEKFSTWTNKNYRHLKNGGLDKDFKLDALLDNVMIYYLTNSITTSSRLYAETFTKQYRNLNLDRVPTDVPTGCARFINDLMHLPDWILQDKFTNLIHSTHYKVGGHFIAMQLPDILYEDFIQFVKKVVMIEKNNITKKDK